MVKPITQADLAAFLDQAWPASGGRAAIVGHLAAKLVEAEIVAEPSLDTTDWYPEDANT